MQNQLFEVLIGKRKGVIVEATITDLNHKDVSLNKYLFTEHAFLGASLKIMQNIPQGYTLSALVISDNELAPKSYHFTVDYDSPFKTFKLHNEVDCFIVSGRFNTYPQELQTL